MSKVILGKAGGKSVELALDVLLRTHLLIWASTGGGKSWLIRRLAEQLFGKVPVIIVDREGEFPTLREKLGFVLVGPGGETPADVRSAKMLAEKLLELRASAVCDLYELKHETRHEWVKAFVTGLVDAPKRLWGPCVVVIDEAHLFAPEKGQGESPAYGAVCDLAGQGRKRGFGIVLATQRLSKLSKNATAEMYNQAAGATARQADRDRAAYEMGISDRKEIKEFSETLRLMDRGTFFFQGRAISMDRVLVKVGPVETTHAEAGSASYKSGPPPTPEKIKAMLPKLADLPKAAEEKARTEAELKVEIRSLKAQLRAQPKVEVQKAVADPKAIERAVTIERRQWQETTRKLKREFDHLKDGLRGIANTAAKMAGVELPNIPVRAAVPIPVAPQPIQRVERALPPVERAENNGKLRAGAERMLAALATWSPNGMAEGQMRSHAGLKRSGTFSAYMSDLRKGQFIEERGGMVYATDAGLEYCKHVPAAPQNTEEVLGVWNPKLRDGARRMLAVLVEAGGEPMTKEELGERAALQKSGTFSAYLSDLKTARLVVVHRDGIVAADKESLFL